MLNTYLYSNFISIDFYKFVLDIEPLPIWFGYLTFLTTALLYNLLLCPYGNTQVRFCVWFLWLIPSGSLGAEICWVWYNI